MKSSLVLSLVLDQTLVTLVLAELDLTHSIHLITEENLIVHIGKCEAKVTNNKRLCSRYRLGQRKQNDC